MCVSVEYHRQLILSTLRIFVKEIVEELIFFVYRHYKPKNGVCQVYSIVIVPSVA